MTIKIPSKEIEVTFPVYLQYGVSLYRIESPRRYTKVHSNIASNFMVNSIEKVSGLEETVATLIDEGEQIPKELFDSANEIALSYITRNEFIESTERSTEEEIREKITANMFVDDLPF